MSSIINKVKGALHHDSTTTHSSGAPEGVAGPHSSRVGNAADPRVDSDLDGRAAHSYGGTQSGLTGTHNHGVTGGTHTHGVTGAGVAGDTAGVGAGYGNTSTHGTHGTHATTGTAGPHSSNLANKVDPTVNSNSYGTGQTGTGVGNHALGTGDRGGLSNSTNAGPHNSNLANKLDPRVDSDLDSTGNRHGASKGGIFGASGSHATAGSGTAQNTNGPHNSDTLNKLDPRVDADGDGSRTIGGNRTHA